MSPPPSPRRCSGVLTALILALTPAPTGSAGDWPQWRGPIRDGHAAKDESLPEQLPDSLAPRWVAAAGPSFASPIVAGDLLFHVDEQNGQETAHAIETATGKLRWSTPYGASAGDEWGSGPRCTPLADDGRLYVQSMRGDFACLDQREGRKLWGFSFGMDYGAVYAGGLDNPDLAARRRGNSGAPVILGDRLFVAVGSTNGASIVCFDKRSGSELWRAGRDESAYAALNAGPIAGKPHVVAYTASALTGLDPENGNVRWRIPLRSHANRHAVTPILDADHVYVSSHTLGTRAFTIASPDAKSNAAAEFWTAPQLKTSLATSVLVDRHLYGQGPDRNFQCVNADTGKVVWSQPGFGEKPLTGYTATLAAGRRLLALSENGQLTLIEANPSAYRELGRQQVCGKNWNHPALAGGTLFIRDQRQLSAIPLTSKPR